MRTSITKWVSIAALLLAIIFWKLAPNFQLALNVVVSASAVVVAVQALQARKFRWAAGFLFVTVLFNPAVPVFRLEGWGSLLLVAITIVPFALSLACLKSQPLLSIPSITDRNPGSRSL